MKRSAFTMVELIVAVLISGIMTTFAVMTFNAVSSAWNSSAEYMDRIQRSDYALNQVISGLRSMYYPHNGEQDAKYGFVLTDNGDGKDPDSSDVIEWAKIGPQIVGGLDSAADTVHRVQLMVLEEGNNDFKEPVQVTGLYARMCPDPALRPDPEKEASGKDYSFSNPDIYQPVLIVDGISGMNCRVMKSPDKAKSKNAKNDETLFDDEWAESNSVPYKVELTLWVRDPEAKSYRTNIAPMMRIVRIPIYEQGQDGASLPSDEKSGKGKGGARKTSSRGGRR